MGTIGDQLNAIKELSLTIHHAYSTSEYASLCSIFQFGSETFDALTQTLQNASDVSSCTNVIESSSLRKFADEYFKLLSAYEESTPMERWKLMASVFS
ncbi:hypothetical protein EV182_005417 [Spiromyces aspiralis]|uniref:Uncharacterized protein n=1 Tax=Spiromyces aspiralis TaxID=68401 RepID=A0ACC1HD81_9FUNG|nr:hypothetical protein EV182_005417 [Spiromyces aspiralis]